VIQLSRVSKEYPRRGLALRDVSFKVGKGEFAFLTGHSGSGKSTTLRLLHMADRPTRGEVTVSGYSSDRISPGDIWKVRRRVGMVFQDFRLLPGRTALENVTFALEVTGTPSKQLVPRAQRLLSQVGLAPKAGALVNELSGGERQRVAVARALANEPVVLLADEPTGNLDERASRGIMELFTELNASGMSVLMATHDIELMRHYPRIRVLELDGGRLVFDSATSTGARVTAAGGLQPDDGGDPRDAGEVRPAGDTETTGRPEGSERG
jgi:cell division transport system ATP-binding protein